MLLNSSQSSFNIIQPLPRFNIIRYGRRIEIDEEENNQKSKINQIISPVTNSTDEDNSSSILITGIRHRDWNFVDDPQDINPRNISNIKYKLIPSINNTIKYRSTNFIEDNHKSQYEEYDLDEQDFQWLIAYNQFRIEKNLPELDENIFEYIMELLEHQCLVGIREKFYQDTIECDACHRVDDIDDIVQCNQCKIFVHKKCYGLDEDINQWICFSCQYDTKEHRCFICDKTGGALKSCRISSDNFNWIHLSCAFWIPNFSFDEKMTPILKHTLQRDGRCGICHRTIGVKVGCCWKNCQDQFHPKCAIDAGQDMFIAENDDKYSIRLLALCNRHREKFDLTEKQIQLNKSLENKQKKFERFTSYINLDTIKTQTLVPSDILESIHTYWILKRKANNCRPLIDLPDDVFYHDYDTNVNLIEFSRQYHQDQAIDILEEKPNTLQFLSPNLIRPSLKNENFFVQFAQRNRTHFINYERNRFCLLDSDRKKR